MFEQYSLEMTQVFIYDHYFSDHEEWSSDDLEHYMQWVVGEKEVDDEYDDDFDHLPCRQSVGDMLNQMPECCTRIVYRRRKWRGGNKHGRTPRTLTLKKSIRRARRHTHRQITEKDLCHSNHI